MIEASLLPPPTVEQFIAALKAAVDKPHVGGKSELYVQHSGSNDPPVHASAPS